MRIIESNIYNLKSFKFYIMQFAALFKDKKTILLYNQKWPFASGIFLTFTVVLKFD